MPLTKKFKKWEKRFRLTYGKKKGTQVTHAYFEKHGWQH